MKPFLFIAIILFTSFAQPTKAEVKDTQNLAPSVISPQSLFGLIWLKDI